MGGSKPLPDGVLKEGMLEEDLDKALEEHGYSQVDCYEVTLAKDYFCADPDPVKRDDERNRIVKID